MRAVWEPREETEQAHTEFMGLLHDGLGRYLRSNSLQFQAEGVGHGLVSGG